MFAGTDRAEIAGAEEGEYITVPIGTTVDSKASEAKIADLFRDLVLTRGPYLNRSGEKTIGRA